MISVMAGSVKYRSVNRNDKKKRMYAVITAVTVCLVIFICIILAIVLQKNATIVAVVQTTPPTVKKALIATSCGMVRGKREKAVHRNVSVFTGIPYAVPPVGKMRWQPTMGLKEGKQCWRGIRNTTKATESCPQFDVSGKLIGSEDCLYLNVWSPELGRSKQRPVMVIVYSHALITGSGQFPMVDSFSKFVDANDVVVVTVSFRLGAFGFLSLDVLSKHSDHRTSGNYGLFDILQALKWVKTNIASFGGNPELVTLTGLSSGGTAAIALSMSPLARDLFQRVISMSGAIMLNTTGKEASENNKPFIKSTGCDGRNDNETFVCLHRLNTEQVLKASLPKVFSFEASSDKFDFPQTGSIQASLPVIDGFLIKEPIYNAKLARGDLKIMIGSTSNEIGPNDGILSRTNQSWSFYRRYLGNNGLFNAKVISQILQQYPNGSMGNTLYGSLDSLSLIATDIKETCPLNVITKKLAETYSGDFYRYVVTNSPENPLYFAAAPFPYDKAFHMWDAYVLFSSEGPTSRLHGRDMEFMKRFQREIIHFLHHGKPASRAWKSIPQSTAVFTNTTLDILTNKNYAHERCKIWVENGFLKYAWNT